MKKQKRTTLILLIIFFVGLSVLLYPTIANYWNSRTQARLVVNYDKIVNDIDVTDYDEFFSKAQNYNNSLAALTYPLTGYKAVGGYDDVMNIDGRGMIGYLMIDKIQLQLPIYHTVSDSVLSVACGHLEGTSFPVEGETTHAVLSAHRGLPSSKLFTNLDRMEEGDVFKVKILDREYLYEIDQIKVVLPSDTNDIKIVDGKEYCTLLTCTPYGINTHRLLVRGVRIDTEKNKTFYVASEAYRIDTVIVTASVAIPMLFILILYVIFKPAKVKLPVDDDRDEMDISD